MKTFIHKHRFKPSKGVCPKCRSLLTTLCNCGVSKCRNCKKKFGKQKLIKLEREETTSHFARWCKVIKKMGDEIAHKKKPITVKQLRRYLKKVPQHLEVELMVYQQSKYRHDPVSFRGRIKRVGIGKYGSQVLTLVADREI